MLIAYGDSKIMFMFATIIAENEINLFKYFMVVARYNLPILGALT